MFDKLTDLERSILEAKLYRGFASRQSVACFKVDATTAELYALWCEVIHSQDGK